MFAHAAAVMVTQVVPIKVWVVKKNIYRAGLSASDQLRTVQRQRRRRTMLIIIRQDNEAKHLLFLFFFFRKVIFCNLRGRTHIFIHLLTCERMEQL